MLLLFSAAVLRLLNLTTLPQGLHTDEIADIRITETARQGDIQVFYNLGVEGREGLYPVALAAVTTPVGSGLLGYRVFSVWIGLITLAVIYAVALRLFGRLAGLSALALMTFGFWPALLSRLIGRETVLPLMMAVALLGLAMALPVYRRRRKRGYNTIAFTSLGALMGLSPYLHPVGLLVPVVSILFMSYMIASRRRMSRRRLRYVVFALVITAIAALPYLVSTAQNADLSGLNRVVDQLGDLSLRETADRAGMLFLRGADDAAFNLPGRPLLDLVTAAVIVWGVVVAVRHRQIARYGLILFALAGALLVALLATQMPAPLAFAPLLPVLAVLFGLGVHSASHHLTRLMTPVNAAWLTAVAWSALILFNLTLTADDLFNRWPRRAETQTAYRAPLGQLAHYIDRTAADIPTVICGWNPAQRPDSAILSDVQLIELMLNRVDLELRFADCATGLVMIDGGARQQVIFPNPATRLTAHPAVREWWDQGGVHINPAIPEGSVLIMNVRETLADRLGLFTVTAPFSYAPEVGGGDLLNPPVSFGGNVTFQGYIAERGPYRPGGIVTVVTFWRVDGRVPSDLQLFTHILADPAARPAANTDTIRVSPRQLRDRDILVQVTVVPLPATLRPGEYRVSVGAYQSTSDLRLNVLENGVPRGDRIFLYPITISQPD